MCNKSEYFVSQWGCEQTNVTFYKVLKRTAKMVTVIEVESKRNCTKWGEYVAVPGDESPHWAKVMRKKVKNFSSVMNPDEECIEINSWSNAYLWSGSPIEGTCYA